MGFKNLKRYFTGALALVFPALLIFGAEALKGRTIDVLGYDVLQTQKATRIYLPQQSAYLTIDNETDQISKNQTRIWRSGFTHIQREVSSADSSLVSSVMGELRE